MSEDRSPISHRSVRKRTFQLRLLDVWVLPCFDLIDFNSKTRLRRQRYVTVDNREVTRRYIRAPRYVRSHHLVNFVYWHPESLGLDIPRCLVDTGDSTHRDRTALEELPAMLTLPKMFSPERIGPDQQRREVFNRTDDSTRLPLKVASPQPISPGTSVTTFTNIQLRRRAFTTIVSMDAIFMAPHLLCWLSLTVVTDSGNFVSTLTWPHQGATP